MHYAKKHSVLPSGIPFLHTSFLKNKEQPSERNVRTMFLRYKFSYFQKWPENVQDVLAHSLPQYRKPQCSPQPHIEMYNMKHKSITRIRQLKNVVMLNLGLVLQGYHRPGNGQLKKSLSSGKSQGMLPVF